MFLLEGETTFKIVNREIIFYSKKNDKLLNINFPVYI